MYEIRAAAAAATTAPMMMRFAAAAAAVTDLRMPKAAVAAALLLLRPHPQQPVALLRATAAASRRNSSSSSSSSSRRFSSSRSSGSGTLSGSDPIRKAGRQRFYLDVGVVPCPAPWELHNNNSNNNHNSVASPISAGVDGTNSASGVVLLPKHQPHQVGGTSAAAHAAAAATAESHLLLMHRTPPRRLLLSQQQHEGDATTAAATTATARTRTNHPWYTVTLDGRPLRTPLGQPLALPSELLAHGICAEWNSTSAVIQPPQMPLMTLACTALDQVASSVSAVAVQYRKQCLSYLRTDTCCYWVDPAQDRILHARQAAAWKDLHDWIERDFLSGVPPPAQAYGTDHGVVLSRTASTTATTTTTTTTSGSSSVFGLPHPVELQQAAAAWVASLDAWHLTALHSACAEAKSFFVAAALVTGHMDAETAQSAARVEEEFNISSWGLVEGQHDYDRLNSAVQLRAASLLTHFLRVDRST